MIVYWKQKLFNISLVKASRVFSDKLIGLFHAYADYSHIVK